MTTALFLLAALSIGFLAGWWACTRNAIRKRQPARASGKLSVKYRGPAHVERTELSHGRAPEPFIVIRGAERT